MDQEKIIEYVNDTFKKIMAMGESIKEHTVKQHAKTARLIFLLAEKINIDEQDIQDLIDDANNYVDSNWPTIKQSIDDRNGIQIKINEILGEEPPKPESTHE